MADAADSFWTATGRALDAGTCPGGDDPVATVARDAIFSRLGADRTAWRDLHGILNSAHVAEILPLFASLGRTDWQFGLSDDGVADGKMSPDEGIWTDG